MTFSDMLPPQAAVSIACERAWAALLHPDEVVFARGYSDARRREFAAGRTCLRRCMQALGHPPVAVPVGLSGQPVLPVELQGSVTHTHGFCAAVVIARSAGLSIGIDCEPEAPLPAEVRPMVLRREEAVQVSRLTRSRGSQPWDTVVFCAKEAYYKAQFAQTSAWLDFHDVIVEIDAHCGTYTVRRAHDAAHVRFHGDACHGRFAFADGFVLCTAVLRTQDPRFHLDQSPRRHDLIGPRITRG